MPRELVVDSFAGGGGASSGIERALGRSPDIAINHNATAIAVHRMNHPESRHYTEDIWKVDPREACGDSPVGVQWLSPDCTHFSRAKGGKPVSRNIRGLAWVAVRWADAVGPRVFCMENVPEFLTWGPLGPDGRPCARQKGLTFKQFTGRLRNLGYDVEWRTLRACDFGAPTSRTRLFLVARRDGVPIRWPRPTHGPGRIPYRTAAECIDWSIPCPSIFDRSRPLAENTLKRIAAGIKRFVIDAQQPFIVPLRGTSPSHVSTHSVHDPLSTVSAGGTHHGLVSPTLIQMGYGEREGQAPRILDLHAPLGTVVAGGAKHALVSAFIAKHYDGNYQAAGLPMFEALSTITTQDHHAVVAASLEEAVPTFEEWYADTKDLGGTREEYDRLYPTDDDPKLLQDSIDRMRRMRTAEALGEGIITRKEAAQLLKLYGTSHAADVEEPMPTVTSGGQHVGVVTSHLVDFKGPDCDGAEVTQPLGTITTHDRYAQVRAFLVAYYGNERDGQSLNDPMRTVTSKERLGLVTVHGVDYAIVDIGMRMLQPRELFNAQGFDSDYEIEHGINDDGEIIPITKTAQVRLCGNSVCPDLSDAIVSAQFGSDYEYDLFNQPAA